MAILKPTGNRGTGNCPGRHLRRPAKGDRKSSGRHLGGRQLRDYRHDCLRLYLLDFCKKSVQEETDCLIKVLFNAPTFGAVHSGGASK